MSFGARWRDAVTLASLLFLPIQGRVRSLYRALGSESSLGERTRYMNLGYWPPGVETLDEAGDALAELLATTAELGPDDEVLDVGFGFADQDLYWMRTRSPRSITGVNISPDQVAIAQARVAEEGLNERIRLAQGDATDLRCDDASFDVVFGLESAFHFDPREAFLREADRVLRPGGRLALADLAAVGRRLRLLERFGLIFGRSFWQVPAANLVSPSTYARQLEQAGFVDVEVRSIYDDVHPPFRRFGSMRLEDSTLKARVNPFFRWMLRTSFRAQQRVQPTMDYVLVSARKGPA